MRKKGQAAMEYLMTYGWAILIIIVVVGALFAMGVFKTESAVACSPCFSNFAFVDYSGGTLLIRNGPQEIQDISVTGGTAGSTTAEPGEDITITGVSTSGDVDLTITYNVTASGLEHSDSATIHN
ncbi:MAG: hypothetical protein GF368_05260 [Candidatus Aenigmarchaeota archaeon]|nr:hypothetical protein [Candidatus Aenigmarchaeota archaeon]